MITKGIIEELVTPYVCKVRIPIYNKIKSSVGSTPTEELGEAAICTLPNSRVSARVGDIVYVAFENNNFDTPVILGFLYKEDVASSLVDIKCRNFKSTLSATLPQDTTIGDVQG